MSAPLRVGIYARVSTSDKDQDPVTQLLPLREFVASQASWALEGEYVDKASGCDLRGRAAWRRLLDKAAKRQLDVILVWRMDRAFRSVLDAANTLERLRGWHIGLRSYGEPWLDTTSPFGEALYYITVAYAQLEKGILVERVKAGMARARKQGRRLGRPQAVNGKWDEIGPRVLSGELSQRKAAELLGVGRATIGRLVAARNGGSIQRPAGPHSIRIERPAQ